ncbi:MAG TPA: dihydroorotase [Gammaproteobacteria bacterium]|nr:dihydroorotase [Gammaproteobacteria bacterium]
MNGKTLAILHGRLLDAETDRTADIYIENGCIAAVGASPRGFRADETIDAKGMIVCPGLIDLCARLREPGYEYKATIRGETRAAALSGITTLCIPPDTNPVIDEPAVVDLIQKRAQADDAAAVAVLGALTTRLEGAQLSEMATLKAAGCCGVSNALRPVTNNRVWYRALEYAATHELTLHVVPLDPALSANGVAHAGAVATRLGLPGIPVSAETVAIAQILALIEETGARVHFGRISSAAGAALIASAKERQLPVSADVALHQLLLNDTAIDGFDSQAHVIPPLRAERDRKALVAAVKSGAIDAICSDHQPHNLDAKQNPFPTTEAGISGLDTLLGLAWELAQREQIPQQRLIGALTDAPGRILKLQSGRIAQGLRADLCILSTDQAWTVEAQTLRSGGKNTPFTGMRLNARAVYTVIAGKLLHCNAD